MEHQRKMIDEFKTRVKKSPLRGFRYYSVLLAMEELLSTNSAWKVKILTKRKTAFLIAERKFKATKH